jgi:hypothetical protein
VQVDAPSWLIGEIATVTVTEVGSNSLFGALTHARAQYPSSESALLPAGA